MSIFLSCYKYPLKYSSRFSNKFRLIQDNSVVDLLLTRRFSQRADRNNKDIVPFLEVLKNRKDEAKRSILVQVQSAQSYKELYTYCSAFGNIQNMFHYTTGVADLSHFILVEFSNEAEVSNVLSKSAHIFENQVVPTHSQFLWFRATTKKSGKLKQSKSAILQCEDGSRACTDNEVNNSLAECKSISEQMTTLHNLTKLNDLGLRLRYLTARQLETTVSGLFPLVNAYPFGSSVNGYGKMGCDLDVVLRLSDEKENEESRLVFHCKASQGTERSANQRNMEAIGDLIHLFLPGCNQVRRILQARVPIIKYLQQLTNVECDLSMTNMSGVHMSDFLYIMGEIDERVRPLIFTIRRWAKENYLTNSSPGRWITNFSLTLLVLAFLQKPLNSPPVLPSLNTLVKQAGSNDKYITEDGIDCTFLRNIKKLNFKKQNTESLESLLLEFFEYYSQFDFESKAICLNETISLTKPEHSPMYIVNPLERGLNVSKNVSIEEVHRFKTEIRNAAWMLESQEHKPKKWGLLSIFDGKKGTAPINFNISHHRTRLLKVAKLFEENEQPEVEYKNETVKKQVENVKKETRERLKVLEMQQKR